MQTQSVEVFVYPDGRVDTRNAALYLGLSEKTLAMMRCNGTGPKFIKMGRVYYFIEDLKDFVDQKAKATSTAQIRHLQR